MKPTPLTLKKANLFVAEYHRHNQPVVGHRFSLGIYHIGQLVAVAICGRPVSRVLDDGLTLEVSRLCTNDDAPPNACSFLYRACWRVWVAMGGNRMITYTLATESGSSLKGAGFARSSGVRGRSWSCPSRHRETHPVDAHDKVRWELVAS
jgi:hypothetical protein